MVVVPVISGPSTYSRRPAASAFSDLSWRSVFSSCFTDMCADVAALSMRLPRKSIAAWPLRSLTVPGVAVAVPAPAKGRRTAAESATSAPTVLRGWVKWVMASLLVVARQVRGGPTVGESDEDSLRQAQESGQRGGSVHALEPAPQSLFLLAVCLAFGQRMALVPGLLALGQ